VVEREIAGLPRPMTRRGGAHRALAGRGTMPVTSTSTCSPNRGRKKLRKGAISAMRSGGSIGAAAD